MPDRLDPALRTVNDTAPVRGYKMGRPAGVFVSLGSETDGANVLTIDYTNFLLSEVRSLERSATSVRGVRSEKKAYRSILNRAEGSKA